MAQSCEKVMGQCKKVKEYCGEQVEECDKKGDPVCEKVMGKCDRAMEQCEREMKEACGKPMESLDKVLGEKSWDPNLSPVDRHVKEMDLGSPLMAGVWVVLGGLAIFTLFLAPFLNSSGISSSSLPTPLIPALPGFPGPQSLFLPRPKLKNHEKCGLVGGGKVRTLFKLKSEEVITNSQCIVSLQLFARKQLLLPSQNLTIFFRMRDKLSK